MADFAIFSHIWGVGLGQNNTDIKVKWVKVYQNFSLFQYLMTSLIVCIAIADAQYNLLKKLSLVICMMCIFSLLICEFVIFIIFIKGFKHFHTFSSLFFSPVSGSESPRSLVGILSFVICVICMFSLLSVNLSYFYLFFHIVLFPKVPVSGSESPCSLVPQHIYMYVLEV